MRKRNQRYNPIYHHTKKKKKYLGINQPKEPKTCNFNPITNERNQR